MRKNSSGPKTKKEKIDDKLEKTMKKIDSILATLKRVDQRVLVLVKRL